MRDLRLVNITLLAKSMWKLFGEGEVIWARVVAARCWSVVTTLPYFEGFLSGLYYVEGYLSIWEYGIE